MNKIKELRERKKIGQRELAEKIGTTQQAISLYERGDRQPKLATWKKLAEFFDVPVSYLRGEQNTLDIDGIIKSLTANQDYFEYNENPYKIRNKSIKFCLSTTNLNQLILIRSLNYYLDTKNNNELVYKPVTSSDLNLEYLRNNFSFIFNSSKNEEYIEKAFFEPNKLSTTELFSTSLYISSTIDNEIKKELSKYSSEEYFSGLKILLNDLTLDEAKRNDFLDTWFAVLKRVTKK